MQHFQVHFQDLGHSFALYGPPSRQITCISFFLVGGFIKVSMSNVSCGFPTLILKESLKIVLQNLYYFSY